MSGLMFPKPERRGRKAATRIRTKRPLGTKRVEAMAAGEVDDFTWDAVVSFYEGLCAYCERRPWAERDHVYPISKGGPNVVENMVPACASCNAEKGQSTRWQPRRVHHFVTISSGLR
jgi:hypothetical protein